MTDDTATVDLTEDEFEDVVSALRRAASSAEEDGHTARAETFYEMYKEWNERATEEFAPELLEA